MQPTRHQIAAVLTQVVSALERHPNLDADAAIRFVVYGNPGTPTPVADTAESLLVDAARRAITDAASVGLDEGEEQPEAEWLVTEEALRCARAAAEEYGR
ncbi:hypothetical protein [Streptomyces iconiensis]|uniref:Uncharacterized protein n=1 Tax=Streptomyces iconiensis TaxID=1384038 RepID=A0ABT7A9D7_9ACTN|nr:hypothetical protein [Streptomyces iconiensis]MDJ1137948.1 hypothetical protein [Streptomyces iconiensis]